MFGSDPADPMEHFLLEDQTPGDPGEPMVQIKSEGILQENFPLLWDTVFFCSIRAFHWLDAPSSHYGGQYALLKVCQFNVNLIQKHLPSKLTH